MTIQSRGVVPPSMDRPKRIAKQLQRIYKWPALSACQQTVAHLYFHKDWHALEQAVRQQDVGAPPLEDLSVDAQKDRMALQTVTLCAELGGVPASTDMVPPPHDAKLSAVERESATSGRYQTSLAYLVVCRLLPTARAFPAQSEYIDLDPECSAANIGALGELIARWWETHIPHQDVVATQWRALSVDPNDRVSLLNAGGYWCELGRYYASSIPVPLLIGVAALFAQRYADLDFQDSEHWARVGRGLLDNDQLATLLVQEGRTSISIYLAAMPREDLYAVFQAQPEAFLANMARAVEILKAVR